MGMKPDSLTWENIMHAVVAAPSVPVGKIRRFGPLGPMYEVGQALRQLDDGDWMIEITLVESGEKTEYRWSQLRQDPQAH